MKISELNTEIKVGVVVTLIILAVVYMVMNITTNDNANTRLEEIKATKAEVEIKLDEMQKIISQQVQVVRGEKEAFLEFQRIIANTKKGQSLGGIMTQVNEKYPNFEVKGFKRVMESIEIHRNEFAEAQKRYNDKVSQYNKFIVRTIPRMLLSDNHVKLEQFVISSAKAKKSMETGVEELEEIKF